MSSVSTAPEELSSNSDVEFECNNNGMEFECSNNGVEFECSNNGVESECSNNSGVESECSNSSTESECSNSRDTSDKGNPLQKKSVTIQQRQRRGHGRSGGRGHGRGSGRGRGRGCGRGRGRGRGGGHGRQQISVPRNVQSRLRYLEHVPSEAVPIGTNDDGFEEDDEFSPTRQVGLHLPTASEDLSELDICQLFVTDEVIDHLVCSTNEYVERNKDKKKFQYRLFKLSPLTCDEMRRYLGVLLLLSISSIRSYRQAWDPKSSQFLIRLQDLMMRHRYEAISTFLHVVSEAEETAVGDSPLKKVLPRYEHVKQSSQTLYQPLKELSVDEHMVKTKARSHLRQYIRNKPTKWGFNFGSSQMLLAIPSTSIYTVGRGVPNQCHQMVFHMMW